MSVKFNIVERGNPGQPGQPKKYYPSIISSGRVSLHDLSAQIASASTLCSADVLAVLEILLTIIPKELNRGNIIELGDFGNIWLRTSSDGIDAPEKVQATQIRLILPRFNAGKRFKDALQKMEFEKQHPKHS